VKNVETKNRYIYGSAAPKLPQETNRSVQEKRQIKKKASEVLPRKSQLPKAKILFCLIFMVAICFVILYRFSAIAELNYRMGELTAEYDRLKNENRALAVEIETSINLDRIKTIAETKLNMHKPESYQLVLVSVPKNNYSVVLDQEYINEKTRNVSLMENIINTVKAILP
jgi:cell division protein FtsL